MIVFQVYRQLYAAIDPLILYSDLYATSWGSPAAPQLVHRYKATTAVAVAANAVAEAANAVAATSSAGNKT